MTDLNLDVCGLIQITTLEHVQGNVFPIQETRKQLSHPHDQCGHGGTLHNLSNACALIPAVGKGTPGTCKGIPNIPQIAFPPCSCSYGQALTTTLSHMTYARSAWYTCQHPLTTVYHTTPLTKQHLITKQVLIFLLWVLLPFKR